MQLPVFCFFFLNFLIIDCIDSLPNIISDVTYEFNTNHFVKFSNIKQEERYKGMEKKSNHFKNAVTQRKSDYTAVPYYNRKSVLHHMKMKIMYNVDLHLPSTTVLNNFFLDHRPMKDLDH